MKTTLVVSALLLLAAPASSFGAMTDDGIPRVASGAGIDAVTVYPDGATITRRGKIALGKGRSIVTFSALTPALDEASIRAKLDGKSGARVTGISADWDGSLEPLREDEAKLTSAIEKLTAAIQAKKDEQQANAARRALLEQYRALAKDAMAQAAGDGTASAPKTPATARWKEAIAFLTKEQDALAVSDRLIAQAIEDLQEDLNAKHQAIAQLRTNEQRRTRRIEVEVEAETAVETEISVEYAVYSAGWFPAYDVRQEESAGKGKLSLVYYGTIVQGTGEDWKNVQLTLSTAKPAEGAQVPTLTTLMLSGNKRVKQPVQIVSYGKKKTKQDQAKSEQTIADQTLSGRAAIDDRGNAVTFTIKGRETLPADRRPHKVEVTTLALDAAIAYETVPKIAPWVFLKATAANKSAFPILAGDVNVFRSSGYVGTSSLEYIAPGEEFAVSLGVDEELKVRRVIDERVDRKPKLLGTTRNLTYAYEIVLENHKDSAQTITLVENIPVTQRKEIKIDLREGTSKPDTKDDEGFLRWKVDLKPGESRTVFFGYDLAYPSNFQLSGL